MNSDYLLERKKLKSSLLNWRVVALIFLTLLLCCYYKQTKTQDNIPKEDFIARIRIYGQIFEDDARIDSIKKLLKHENIKAFVLHIDSPGGSFVGGESLYIALRKLSSQKPMVTVIGGMAASGGYMVALASDHIIAYKGSITGSVGVILESFEVTELLKAVGVQPMSFKSSPFKAMPNFIEKMTPETTKAIQELTNDLHESFISMVSDRRKEIPKEQLEIICNGRAYSGTQALQNKLIDEIGDEESALNWLQKQKEIDEKLEIKDIELKSDYSYSQSSYYDSCYGVLSYFLKTILNTLNNAVNEKLNSVQSHEYFLNSTNKALS